MKRYRDTVFCLAVILLLTAGLLFAGTIASAKSILLGDVNQDGAVTAADRTLLSRYVAGWPFEGITFDPAAADINRDGLVSSTDRTLLARHLADWDGYESLDSFAVSSASSNVSSGTSSSTSSDTSSNTSSKTPIHYNSDNSGWSSRWY